MSAECKTIRIGFTGNRFGLIKEQVSEINIILNKYLIDYKIIALHGDCVGADTEFHKICELFNILIHIYPPDENKLRGFNKGIIMDPKPYLKRNDDIR